MRTFYALFIARNREFLRDRGTLAWNLLFPFLAVFIIAMVFSGDGRQIYKVGIVAGNATENATGNATRNAAGNATEFAAKVKRGDWSAIRGDLAPAVRAFLAVRHIKFVPLAGEDAAREKVRYHTLDMALALSTPPRYWVNPDNPKGYVLERVLWGAGSSNGFVREALSGRQIRYVDWLLPGILSMNMMFSCLWGVGYVIVRYRKGGVLRRLKAAPITAFQFITAQIASRMMLVLFITTVLFFGMDLVLDFFVLGSILSLFLTFALGAACLIALGILISARIHSLELAGGLLNLASWPMMFLSGVWFSLEGSDQWLIWLSKAFPLTHMVNASRAIMIDGATLLDVWPELALLSALTVIFLALGSLLFRWE